MLYTHNITSKGQITIPKEFREKLGLDEIGKATLRLSDRGEVVLGRPKSLDEIRAGLGRPTRKDSLTKREKSITRTLLRDKKYRRYAKKFN